MKDVQLCTHHRAVFASRLGHSPYTRMTKKERRRRARRVSRQCGECLGGDRYPANLGRDAPS